MLLLRAVSSHLASLAHATWEVFEMVSRMDFFFKTAVLFYDGCITSQMLEVFNELLLRVGRKQGREHDSSGSVQLRRREVLKGGNMSHGVLTSKTARNHSNQVARKCLSKRIVLEHCTPTVHPVRNNFGIFSDEIKFSEGGHTQ